MQKRKRRFFATENIGYGAAPNSMGEEGAIFLFRTLGQLSVAACKPATSTCNLLALASDR